MFKNVSSSTRNISARWFQICVAIVGISLICGCEGDPNRVLGPGNLQVINQELRHQYLGEGSAVQIPALDRYRRMEKAYAVAALANPNDPTLPSRLATLKIERDSIVNGLIAIDDYNFQDYASRTGLYQRMSSTAGDIVVLGLTSAAAVTGGQQAKSILAGVAALITGSRIAVDKEVFYQSTLPVLLDRMQSMRVADKKAIQDKLATKSVTDYPLDAAICDVLDYFHDGTLFGAVANIAKDTANKTPAPPAPAANPSLDALATAINKSAPPISIVFSGVTFKIDSASWDAAYTVLTVKETRTSAPTVPPTVVQAADLGAAVRAYLNNWTDPASGAPEVAASIAKQFSAASIKFSNQNADGTVP